MKTLITLLLTMVMLSCAPYHYSNNSAQADGAYTNQVTSNQVNPTNPSISLADYLKRIPGVQVAQRGGTTEITVRGNNSLDGEREPLFVINGMNVGFGYEKASPLVDINDIKNVRVLKSGQETANYGMQGNNGVILITTKR